MTMLTSPAVASALSVHVTVASMNPSPVPYSQALDLLADDCTAVISLPSK